MDGKGKGDEVMIMIHVGFRLGDNHSPPWSASNHKPTWLFRFGG